MKVYYIENWWTRPLNILCIKTPLERAEGRVRYWLIIYRELEVALRLDSSLDAEQPGMGSGQDDMTAWERKVTTKADLDIALRCCTRKQRAAVKAKFHSGLSYADAADRMSCSRQAAHQHCQKAIVRMAKFLAGEVDKTGVKTL